MRNRAAYDLEDHAARHGMPAGGSVVDEGTIPYQPWALVRRQEHAANRASADPLAQCYTIVLPDGRRLLAGSPPGEGAPR